MPGPKRGYTTCHRCATVKSSRRNQPSDRDRQARQKLQEKTSDFQVTFDDNVYMSLGPEAKQDIYNTFNPDKLFNIHLDPPSTEQPPLVKIKQEGKPFIYTTDFYFTNKLPSNIAVPPQGANNNTPNVDQAKQQTPHYLIPSKMSKQHFMPLISAHKKRKNRRWQKRKKSQSVKVSL